MQIINIVRNLQHYLIYHLRVKKRLSRLDHTSIMGFDLSVPPTVFHPLFYYSSIFMAKYLSALDFTGKTILDIGSGSGILSIVAASKGGIVTSIDVNQTALRATRENAQRNGFEKVISVLQSDLFSNPVLASREFDVIIANPPFFRGDPISKSDFAWKSGEDHEYFRRLAEGMRSHLTSHGKAYIVLSTDADIPLIRNIFLGSGYVLTINAQIRKFFERLIVFEIRDGRV